MSLARGERVAFCGSSGAGKATLVDLFFGLRLPDQGKIMVDSINLRGCPLAWQQRIGYLPQAIALRDASVLANVSLGDPADVVDAECAWQALSATGLAAPVSSLPSGIHSPIGERGGRLSCGQRQRLGLARALYRRPDVLVLNEPTNALDPASRDEILECLGSTMEGITMLIISYEIEVLKPCQRKLELLGGFLVGCEEFQCGVEA
jgi:ATP-binding cassette, subfamily B, bacterial PglK